MSKEILFPPLPILPPSADGLFTRDAMLEYGALAAKIMIQHATPLIKEKTNSLFLKSKELGIIETHCIEALRETFPKYTARDRSSKVKHAVKLLKDLKLIPQNAEVTALGKGVSLRGEFGILVLFERKIVDAQGPKASFKYDINKYLQWLADNNLLDTYANWIDFLDSAIAPKPKAEEEQSPPLGDLSSLHVSREEFEADSGFRFYEKPLKTEDC